MSWMESQRSPWWSGWNARLARFAILLALHLLEPASTVCVASAGRTNATLIEIEGRAVVARAGSAAWDPAYPNQPLFPGDRLRTLERARAVVRLSDLSLLRLAELTHIQIPAPTRQRGGFHLLRGLLYFFHRDRPGVMPVTTPTAYAVVLGTEFTLASAEDGSTRLDLLHGTVEMTNQFGGITLASGEAARAGPGSAPVKAPAFEAVNAIQWVLYYPAVLDPGELELSDSQQAMLRDSLAAYRAGDLLGALAAYPAVRTPPSDAERIYVAALLLGVGQTAEAEQHLNALEASNASAGWLAGALRKLVAAVKFQSQPSTPDPRSATALLAESFYRQSRSDLPQALELARRAVEVSPDLGFGWARVAELEFSFGRIGVARAAVRRSLELAPRNAQAIALQGFLLAADNQTGAAIRAFDEAILIQGALGNAWLGRGLCRIRQGEVVGGREDLQVAAALEPQRAVLRSYLAKAFADAGDGPRAKYELDLAKALDPNDPTAWLYSALLNQQLHQINEGIGDLERSQELNDRRSVFRSRALLDQDRAVRSANLAALYQDAGMFDVSVHEAGRAVAVEYANPAAHLFLANSFNALRDPNLANLRYETPTFSEYLVANLLAPVGATLLSPQVSQQEYSRLFERNRVGLSSSSQVASDGSWAQAASQFGVLDNVSYALDGAWRSRDGQRANNDLSQFLGSVQFKAQLTPRDSLYVLGTYSDLESGDTRQLFDASEASPTLRMRERQEPNLFAGYDHEWAPGVHTLVLGARLNDRLGLREPRAFIRTLVRDRNGVLTGQVDPAYSEFDLDYHSGFDAWSGEVQHILERSTHTLVAGARYQAGEVKSRVELRRDPFAFPPVFPDPAAVQEFQPTLERASAYVYEHWRVVEPLLLIGGVSYDWLRFPDNSELPPLSAGEATRGQLSPKAGFVWTPSASTSARGAYTRSLGGLFYDGSVRLEPTQLAGFVQSYRSLIPESVTGAVPGTRFETFHLGLDRRFVTRTYAALEAEWLRSEGARQVGLFDYTDAAPFLAVPSSAQQRLEFAERSLTLALHQLVGAEWVLGARYRLSHADLEREFTALPPMLLRDARTTERATLHTADLFAIWQNAAGFFARCDAVWQAQSSHHSLKNMPGDDFWQFNVQAGYRFARRRAEISLGLLNLTDRDYRLNPLNAIVELPRKRTFVANFEFNF